MLCLVRQPNAVILEVEVDPKAKGKQCLDKVCEMLGIIESDYMGLQYTGPHGEKLWLNMRNQIRRQMAGPPPYRLHLRVKFFVPPHLLLQDVTRHFFFLDVKQDFVDGRLRSDSMQLSRLAALIAQAELGDYDPSNLASCVVCYRKLLPPNCFSLDGHPPQLRVRWRSGGSRDSESAEAPLSDTIIDNISIETDRTAVTRICQSVMQEHLKLVGTKPTAAEYLFLKESSDLEDFGMEQYFVKTSNGETLRVGVGPSGVVIHDMNLVVRQSLTYAAIHMATHSGRCVFLNYISHDGESHALGFKLENYEAASALYRAVTEKHAFYSCETVRNSVTSQFIRDLKGTIVSLFNENTPLGKNYVFDIQRTCREVYDHTRRVIYQMETNVCKENSESTADSEQKKSGSGEPHTENCHLANCKNVHEQLAAFQDSMLCRVCMDADVNTVFFPCRHVACCSSCAPLCKACPLCRGNVEDAQHVYLPCVGQKKTISGT